PVSDHRADVPSVISDLVARCLEKEPSNRPQSAADVLSVLDGASTGPTPVPARKRPWAPLAAAIGIVGVLAVVGAYVIHRPPPEPLTLAAIPFHNVAR